VCLHVQTVKYSAVHMYRQYEGTSERPDGPHNCGLEVVQRDLTVNTNQNNNKTVKKQHKT
jgi:hypothetical protein